MTTAKFQIKARYGSAIRFECEVDASLGFGEKMGAAIKAALKAGAVLRDANLSDADLSGADLSGANLSDANLSDADLSGADLSGANLSDANLSGADLRGADLSGAVLSGADLSGADLSGADLSGADLRGADLRGAVLRDAVLPPAPVVPNIDAAILGEIEAGAGLEMDNWHTCETTHCIAGWAIVLAGKEGRDLEAAVGPAAAGALIYAASNPAAPIPDFYATNEKALADLRKRAGKSEAAA